MQELADFYRAREFKVSDGIATMGADRSGDLRRDDG